MSFDDGYPSLKGSGNSEQGTHQVPRVLRVPRCLKRKIVATCQPRQNCAQNKRTCGRLCSTPSDDDGVPCFCQLFSNDSNYQYFCPAD